MTLSDVVRHAALWPESDLPEPPPEHPFTQVRRDGYTIGHFHGMTLGNVTVEATEPAGGVEQVVDEARKVLAESGKTRGAWFVPEAASPPGLVDALRSIGMVPFDEPPHEPRYAGMALVTEPEPGPPEIEARLAETLAEFRCGRRLSEEAFAVPEQDRAAAEAREQELWELELRLDAFRTFVAILDGDVVGSAAIIFGGNAAFLAGGSTRRDMRGRGAYRALVRARWDAAARRGTPALTVGAGRMSRPILERLGFVTVGWIDCLLDDFA